MERLICPRCHEEVDPYDLLELDVGGSEDVMGSRVHVPCLIYLTPCCSQEPVIMELSDAEDAV